MLHSNTLEEINSIMQERDISKQIALAMGLKTHEITKLTDTPIYIENT